MIHCSELHKIPQLPGVYFLYSKRKKLVYIGRAWEMRTRLVAHQTALEEHYKCVGSYKSKFAAPHSMDNLIIDIY